jgi:L-seryl-tRNA(Ser) seleniumtransferase
VIAREVIGEWRRRVRAGSEAPDVGAVLEDVARAASERLRTSLRRVVNATGVVLHTNLGRAPLPAASVARIVEVAAGYCSLELDPELGVRLRRGAAAEAALAALVGGDDAVIVNNNAAAVLLCLCSVACGREVLVSRGELVEVGGGFRIPAVLERSGAKLVEVGTTNRTRVTDYTEAISERTACALRVHPSNFKMTGFCERPLLAELVAVMHARGLPVVKDLGGGLIVDPTEFATSGEPTVQACLRAGADLVCFSLDKLFGGPQGGAVVGSRERIAALRRDPLMRAVRVDKLMLAALEPVLDAYARGDVDAVVVQALLRTSVEELERRLAAWQNALGPLARETRVTATEGAVGGGALAEEPVTSRALTIRVEHPDAFAARLRRHDPPVIARIEDGLVLIDARTVLPGEDEHVIAALRAALESKDNANDRME